MNEIAEVVVSIKNKNVDRVFHYAIPPELRNRIQTGMRALVPFGGGNRVTEGYITGFCETTDTPPHKLKGIQSLPDAFPLFTPEMLALAQWMRDKYYTTLADCLHCIMPAGISLRNTFAAVLADGADGATLKGKQQDVFLYVKERGGIVAQRELYEQFGAGVQRSVAALYNAGLLFIKQDYELKDYALRVKYAFLNDDNPLLDTLLDATFAKRDKQADVLQTVLDHNGMAVSDLKAYLHISDSPIKTLVKNGLLKIETVERLRMVTRSGNGDDTFTLTAEQEAAVASIFEELEATEKKPVLIYGVTGSGKTEVYMRLIERVMAQGKQTIMLVPEISLTPQTIEAFTNRFGDRVTFTHSRLSLGERFDQWKKARDGRVDVMIGPRSAIFAPFERLGAIVIDEEHESTYKSESTPKYDVKEVAQERARLTGSLVVMGSATPDVGSFYRAKQGEFGLITLKNRVNRRMPDIQIADMRYELADGNRSVFSRMLAAGIAENLRTGEQTILFMNRRGHSSFVSCRACGHVIGCESCSIRYTYHRYTDKLLCHYCGKQERMPKRCPICGSEHIRFFGAGTQKIEAELTEAFSQARVLRMDMDTTSRKNSHESIIARFAAKEADILIGTQMIAKGLNFPGVSLVGIVAADIALHADDFRAAETAYQLMTQVSGRAGRATIPGRVVVQTYSPEHYSIQFAKEQNYERFYAHEIILREQMQYPPFTHLAVILLTGESEKELILTLNTLRELMQKVNRRGFFEMLGPAPAAAAKLRNTYRWKLIVKGKDEVLLKQFVFYCMDKLALVRNIDGMQANISIDPANIP